MEVNMKRKPLIVLLVLLLVGILAFTVFACNNNSNSNKNQNNSGNNNDDKDDDDNGDEDDTTYAIAEALPKLVTGIDKVAATVGDINEGKAAYLGADIGLVLGVTAEDVKAIDLDLGLSLKVSVDEKTAANNWALLGLTSGGKEIAQLFVTVENGKENIYLKEALTGSKNWMLISVLDTSDSDLTGLFTTPGSAEPDSKYNDEGVVGFDTETGYHYVYSGGLIGRLFSLVEIMVEGPFAKATTEKVGDEEVTVYEPEGGSPAINFDSDTPISSIDLMKGLSLNTILGLVNTLDLGELLDGVLHAEAYDNGSGYTAELNRTGIGALLTKLIPTIKTFAKDLDLYGTLRDLNPILSMVLGMSVDEDEDTFIIDEKANPELTIDFSLNDDAALENLSIDFSNPDIEGLGIELGVAIKNIEIAGEAKKPSTEVSEYEKLGLNLALEAKLPGWAKTASAQAASIAVSVDPDATIGWDENGKIQIDLSDIKGYATFNGKTIAEYTTLDNKKGFAIDLGPVYDFIAPSGTDDQRDNVYFINCDLAKIVASAMNPSTASAASELSNAAYADETATLTGTLGKLITAIKAGVKLTNIGDVIGPILTEENNLVGMLLDLLGNNGAVVLDPALGEDLDGDISVTVDAGKLVDFAMGGNLLGGIESMINITLYDESVAEAAAGDDLTDVESAANTKQPITLSKIFDSDLVEVMIDLVYTAMYENYAKTNPGVTFAQYVQGGDIIYNRDGIAQIAAYLGFDLGTSFDAADLGNIVATINYGDSLYASLEVLGAYILIGADLDTYAAPTASIDTTGAEPMGTYTDQGKLVVAFNGSNLEKALLELAGYALGGQKDLFL